MEQIAQREGIQWVQVPFKGGAENIASLLGGHTMALADSTGWAEQVNSGKARLLVTWGAQRTKRWPDVPTLKDLGYPIVSNSPYGLAGPRGMDPAVVKVLHDAFKKALDDPEYQKTLEKFDQEAFYLNSADYAALAKKILRGRARGGETVESQDVVESPRFHADDGYSATSRCHHPRLRRRRRIRPRRCRCCRPNPNCPSCCRAASRRS